MQWATNARNATTIQFMGRCFVGILLDDDDPYGSLTKGDYDYDHDE